MMSRTPAQPSRPASSVAASEGTPSHHAVEFVRFCYRRRRVGWPELYDEMCAVAARQLFRGWDVDELNAQGIGLCLFEMPALAALTRQVVAEEQHHVMVAIPIRPEPAVDGPDEERPPVQPIPVVVPAGA